MMRSHSQGSLLFDYVSYSHVAAVAQCANLFLGEHLRFRQAYRVVLTHLIHLFEDQMLPTVLGNFEGWPFAAAVHCNSSRMARQSCMRCTFHSGPKSSSSGQQHTNNGQALGDMATMCDSNADRALTNTWQHVNSAKCLQAEHGNGSHPRSDARS
jgi:hypothetical protein